MNNKYSYERYSRQTLLKGFGEAGQEKLLRAKVLVIGAGGLGCPALQYLAAAGVGTIGIVDNDIVSLSNLHRQPLYSTADIGLFKSETAAKKLGELNPEISFSIYNERLTSANALEILAPFDIIVDGTDNFATRYLVNDACVLLDKPLVYGAVSQFEGQIAVFNFHSANNTPAVNYRDLFPNPPKENEVLNCAEAGVIGVLPGIIGTMQASETIKLITGIGKPLINSLLSFNALNNQTYEVSLQAKKETRSFIPTTKKDFESMNYEWLCAAERSPREIDITRFDELIAAGDTILIDVREPNERPEVTEFMHERVPLSTLIQSSIKSDAQTIVVFCQSGKRSLEVAEYLYELNDKSRNVYSLKGGILKWKEYHQKKETV
jgi:adenylyltransferase/sulfurtransferase